MHAGCLRFGHPGLVLLHILQQAAPQSGLPALGLGQGLYLVAPSTDLVFAPGPILQPVGAVILVAIKHIGHLQGELVSPARRRRLSPRRFVV